MSDTRSQPGAGGQDDRESPPGMPRWVKVPLIIIGILVLLFVILQLTGLGGEHGPGRHLSAGQAAPAAAELLVRG